MFETEIIDEYGTANRRIWDALINIITYTEILLDLKWQSAYASCR